MNRILVIEDDELDQMAIRRYIKEECFSCDYTMTSSVSETCLILESGDFDLIFADYRLGDGTVFDIMPVAKGIPLVVVTGVGNEEIAVKAMKKGACDYLVKDSAHRYLQLLPVLLESAIKIKMLDLELKLEEERRNRLIVQLEKTNKELEGFAHVVSHDLKAPLRGIRAISGWLLADYGEKLDNEGRNYLKLLQQRTIRMYDLIDDILRYSKAGNYFEKLEEMDINILVRETFESIAPSPEFRLELDAPLPKIWAEKSVMVQIFQNLLSNAINFSDKAPAYIRVASGSKNGMHLFTVTDNGVGIADRHQERIFSIFQTLGKPSANQGTGIGLAIVRKLVEAAGGKVWVESKEGEGACFSFTYPKDRPIEASSGFPVC